MGAVGNLVERAGARGAAAGVVGEEIVEAGFDFEVELVGEGALLLRGATLFERAGMHVGFADEAEELRGLEAFQIHLLKINPRERDGDARLVAADEMR